MRCVDCGNIALFLYNGNSLCKEDLRKRGIKDFQFIQEEFGSPQPMTTKEIEDYLKEKQSWLYEP